MVSGIILVFICIAYRVILYTTVPKVSLLDSDPIRNELIFVSQSHDKVSNKLFGRDCRHLSSVPHAQSVYAAKFENGY